jgi:hypothetical protein
MAIANKISATAMSTNRAKVCINLLSPPPWVRTHGDLVTEMAARRKAAPQDGPHQRLQFLEMLGLDGALVRFVDLPLALAPMSPFLPGLAISGKLCLGSFVAPAAGGIRWS